MQQSPYWNPQTETMPREQLRALQGHRLSRLQMRITRHQRVGFFLCLIEQRGLQIAELSVEGIDRLANPQLEVRGHLVIARATGVQTSGRLANDLLEPGLDVHVDVFQRFRKCEAARFDFRLHLL